ncbi:hypothetical protein HJG60_009398 [Phyllostomus discolor]|uniref:Uncharacterized protein n=1 Tax=Phyllostomus discolor TaxID=89673 RepID=A0A834DC13_9CHIR|nr:hypothetical protein HJG60_009398 [Phyllostomus discolor]
MSYPLSRSPHLSQRSLPVSVPRVQTFEVDGAPPPRERGRAGARGARGAEALQHRGQRPLQPTPRERAATPTPAPLARRCLRNDRPPGRLPRLLLLPPPPASPRRSGWRAESAAGEGKVSAVTLEWPRKRE